MTAAAFGFGFGFDVRTRLVFAFVPAIAYFPSFAGVTSMRWRT